MTVSFLCIPGLSGDVAINSHGNRVPVFVFSNRQNGSVVPIAEIDETNPGDPNVTIYNVTTIWPSGTTVIPRDAPECGFRGDECVSPPEGMYNRTIISRDLYPIHTRHPMFGSTVFSRVKKRAEELNFT